MLTEVFQSIVNKQDIKTFVIKITRYDIYCLHATGHAWI